ncbi:cation channel sperm-associated protein subunit gamma [Alligator sinensis]|uniref:Cation channel sperm-associated protein subunit gamma n=1 Tax=Alligator sinensis TaxID=38654 RepID=A0A3Q0HB84_ALLSI|nr:cation channel sperm-associated protein subunit gamma [Alligator sinensis]
MVSQIIKWYVLAFMLLPTHAWLIVQDCEWNVVLNSHDDLGGEKKVFHEQLPVHSGITVFHNLTDSPVNLTNKNSHYLAFPYYLKINLTCTKQDTKSVIRQAFLNGLNPVVTVTFEEPIDNLLQKAEQLQIEMEAAPYRIPGLCDSEEVCHMSWFTPMPIMNGSVDILVESNGLGLDIEEKRFFININGYVRNTHKGLQSSIGQVVPDLGRMLMLGQPSRPIWSTYEKAPVRVLGDFPDHKVILLSNTEFSDFTAIEVAIDSCWIGSLGCPQEKFSSTISDAISLESVLFIRQNQLVYYFIGRYAVLQNTRFASTAWNRVLNNVCVAKLNPVPFPYDGEYILALGGGSNEGEVYIGSIQDTFITFNSLFSSKKENVCTFLKTSCRVIWAIYQTEDSCLTLLVQETESNQSNYSIVSYSTSTATFKLLYHVPPFVPKDTNQGFVMLVGLEEYTTTPLVPRGLSYSPFSTIFYIWGNVILQSYDAMNYIYLSEFPSQSPIKYFVQSYRGDLVWVTESEEIWFSLEGSSVIRRVYPSQAWSSYFTMQLLMGSRDFGLNESFISLFFNKDGLHQLVYIVDPDGTGRLVQRKFPLSTLLPTLYLSEQQHYWVIVRQLDYISFPDTCLFASMRMHELPAPQRFTRMEHYRILPPDVMDETGFHNNFSLSVYQGLVFELLWLHTDYNRPYADPVHDPMWRWWKNKQQYEDYYFYVASNRNSSGGVYVKMSSYTKSYDLMPNNELPEKIYLDKYNEYSFSVFLSITTTEDGSPPSAKPLWDKGRPGAGSRGSPILAAVQRLEEKSLEYVWLTVVLAHPAHVASTLQRQELMNRGSLLYKVTIRDRGHYPRQELSGLKALTSSMTLKVMNSALNCHRYTGTGLQMQGYEVVPIYIGCPPGKRLAFDITRTLRYSAKKNNRYYDCISINPDMPCFFFDDIFYPFFLIQDMVTGESGLFHGNYTLKIIGGGAYKENIREFTYDKVEVYNPRINGSPPHSLIWTRADLTKPIRTDPSGHIVLAGTNNGIRWLCRRHSPCHDILPSGLLAPDYYFLLEVTNRGVDESTYCDYDLDFIIHVHGLPLSPERKYFYVKITMAILWGLLIVYILYHALAPKIRALWTRLLQRLEDIVVLRSESMSTFSSPHTSFSLDPETGAESPHSNHRSSVPQVPASD